MLISIISDTHRDYDSINKVIDKISNCNCIIHLGDNLEDGLYIKERVKDKIFINVKGNCDYGKNIPSELFTDIGDKKFFITHGHNYGVKEDTLRLKYKAQELGADIALYGHTHIPSIEKIDGIWIINPGSASLPRISRKTIAFIEISDQSVNPYIFEL